MFIVKYITIFIALLCAIAAAYWVYVRITLGEGGCTVHVAWVEENWKKRAALSHGQLVKENILLFDFLQTSIEGPNIYESRVRVLNSDQENLLIKELDVKYVFSNRLLKPVSIELKYYKFCAKRPCPSRSLRANGDEISNISLSGNERVTVVSLYDINTDDPVFNQGEIRFTLKYVSNGESNAISEHIRIKKVTEKYNCLW